MSKYENEFKNEILEPAGYVVIRSAGSLGEADLVAIEPETAKAFLVECKAVKGDTHYISRRKTGKEQYTKMMEHHRQGVPVIYAIRWKGLKSLHGADLAEKWDIFPMDELVTQTKWPIMRQGKGKHITDWVGEFLD